MNDVRPADSASSARSTPTVTRPFIIWSVAIAGGLFAASPFALTLWVNEDFGAWEVVLATTLTNIGTTLALAVILFILERHFTQSVTEAVTEQARNEVATQTQDLRDTTRALQQRVSDIAQELDERRQAHAQEQEAVIRSLRDGVSFDTVASALERANELRALRFGSVTVPAGLGLDSPRVRLFWGDTFGTSLATGNVFDDAAPAIVLSYEVPYDQQVGGYTPASARWRYGQSATDALEELISQMQKAGYVAEAAQIGPDMFTWLADALAETMRARIGMDHAWLSGRLDEWIADGWAITDMGLESREGVRVAAHEFPDARFNALPAAEKTPPVKFSPPAPAGVDADLWAFAIERSRHKFSGSQSVAIAASGRGPVAYTPSDSPRTREYWPPTSS